MAQYSSERLEALLLEALSLVRAGATLPPEVTSIVTPPQAAPVPVPEAANDASWAFGDYGKFYDFLRGNKLLGPKISTSEYKGCDAIIQACAKAGYPVSFTAYALATAFLETDATMQPIKEKGGPTYFHRMYDIGGARPGKAKELGNLRPGEGALYAGRGYVQLTGKNNYIKATAELRKLGIDCDLVARPDDAMLPHIAATIMVLGMRHGWFTTRKLSDDLRAAGPSTYQQFKASRDIINGHDREDDVASFAVDFQTGLMAATYKIAA